MPRALWSGAISFGLVNVPVKMVSAVRDKDIHFHLLHADDGARIKFQRVCPKDGAEVTMDEIVRGFEVSKGHYVTFTDEELAALDPKASRSIDIQDFVKQEEIDPAFYEKPYYLLPDKGAEKAYGLLVGALKKSKKVAVARVVTREKEHLVAIRVKGNALVVETMRYHDEVVDTEALGEELAGVPKADPRELTMATQLVDALTAKFDPEKYRNEHRERLLDVIEQKAAGKEVVTEPEVKAVTRTTNLMDALQASLKAAKTRIATGDEDVAAEA
ncbi:MAG TPA: Ku protein [Candidatus Thermoplasmatota archaeon]|nr:Ku protein [Candidatus Thermoplasmatota archaeon]